MGNGYDNIEKLTSIVCRPGGNMILKHTVKVANKDKDRKRVFGHTEYSYTSDMYLDKKFMKMIKLNFSSYLTIEETNKDWTEKESVYIGASQLQILRSYMKKVRKWFYKDKYKNLYYEDEYKRLKLSLDFKDLSKLVPLGQKAIKFQPVVIEIDSVFYEGVKMTLNKASVVSYMTIDSFEEFYYHIKKFDLYANGLLMMNYLRRPDFDIYNEDIENNKYSSGNTNNSMTSSAFRTDVTDDKVKGFFEKC